MEGCVAVAETWCGHLLIMRRDLKLQKHMGDMIVGTWVE